MRQFRLVALLPLAVIAGCYRANAQSQSTLLEPHYVSGPPGGAADPSSAYAGDPASEPSDPTDPTDDDTADDAQAPAELAPQAAMPGPGEPAPIPDAEDPADLALGPAPAVGEAAPGPGEPGGDLAEEATAPGAPGVGADPTAGVTDVEIDAALDGYGQWIQSDDYGPVWRPDATVVGVDFTPYESGGSWAYTDAGWAFSCDYPWGWLPFHYGRWAWFQDYWGWVPGHRWGPAWVEWRHGGGVVGWRPMRPRVRDHRHGDGRDRDQRRGSGSLVRDHRRAEQHDAHWRFATVSDFGRPHIRSHRYGNLAEGLRVTSTVKAPPLRARTTVRAGDLMRNRFAGARAMAPGRSGWPQPVRDHRGSTPPTRYQPSYPAGTNQPPQAGRAPIRTYQPPSGTYQPPGRIYQPPVRAQPPAGTYQPPVRTQPPAGTYQPPVRTYQPGRTYQPPVRTYQPPVRTYQPPGGTYQPPVRTYQPPGGTYQPPVRTYQPPVRTHQPPGGTYQPPVRTYQPPVRTNQPPGGTYQPPVRTYQPPARPSAPASAPPARSASPPPSSSSSGSHGSNSSSSHSSSSGGGQRHR